MLSITNATLSWCMCVCVCEAITCIMPGRNKVLYCDILILILLMWRIWWAPNNAGKWQMGFNSAFKGLNIYRVSQEECARLREGVPYVKVYWYNPKHLCPKLNGYGDNGQRKVWSSGGSTHCTCQLTLSMSVLECGVILRQFRPSSL